MALTTNLDHYWKHDESSGNTTDTVGSLTGTNSSVTFGTGKINNGAVFDAGADYISFSDTTTISGTSDFTLAFWIKYTSGLFIIQRRTTVPVDWQFVNNGGSLDFQFGATNTFVGAGIGLDSNWHHIAVTRSGTTSWNLYKDGSSVATSSASGSISTGQGLRFGDTSEALSLGAIMTLDEVGIWSRALSSTEVSQLYNGGSGLAHPFNLNTFSKSILGTRQAVNRASTY